MSFRFRFIFSFIVVEALFILSIVVLNFSSLERQSQQLLNDKTALASSMFNEIVTTPLLINDFATIDDAAARFVSTEGTVQVRLYNQDGNLISEAYTEDQHYHDKNLEAEIHSEEQHYHDEGLKRALENNLIGLSSDGDGIKNFGDFSFLTIEKPITVDGKKIGSTSYVFDISRSIKTLKNNAFWTYLLVGIEILISTIVALLMGLRIASEIDKLCRVTNEISHDRHVEIPKYKKRGDEIDQLYDSISLMYKNIKERTAALKEETQKAKAASKAKSEFLSVMSHEIRTPINGIVGSLNLIDTPMLQANDAEHIETALTSSELLLATVNDILDCSQIESGKFKLKIKPISIAKIVSDIEKIYRPMVEEKGLEFVVNQKQINNIYAHGDPVRIEQIVGNYLNNAIKFTNKGTITLNAYKTESGETSFDVIDDGIGIKEEDIKLLFQDFTQVNQGADREFDGSGLGLSLTKHIANLMGGDVAVSSEYGKGSCFSVTVKLEPTTKAEYEASRPKPVAKAQNDTEKLNIKILLVEDNRVNQIVARRLLEKAGCEVVVANNGVEAIESIEKENFEIVLMDCQMPIMDGLTATRKIRESGCVTPIVALTANIEDSNRQACKEVGMNEFISKPFKPQDLYPVITEQLHITKKNQSKVA